MSELARQLSAYLASASGGAFDWRSANCAHFAAGWVRWATGRDVRGSLPERGNMREWARLARDAGGMQVLVTDRLRCQPIAPAFARLGDIVLLPGALTGTLAVCNGRTAVCPADPRGTVFLPMSSAIYAWRLAEITCA